MSWLDKWRLNCRITALALNLTLCVLFVGTSVVTVTATDADDQTYGNSAKLVYSILQGQPYFSVDSENGEPCMQLLMSTDLPHCSVKCRWKINKQNEDLSASGAVMLTSHKSPRSVAAHFLWTTLRAPVEDGPITSSFKLHSKHASSDLPSPANYLSQPWPAPCFCCSHSV